MAFTLINLWQTTEERREKYHLARICGATSYWAMVMRDWRLNKIERFFGLPITSNYQMKLKHAKATNSVRD